MRNDRTTGALVAAATISNKTINQDACALVRNAKAPLAGIVVADGLGSHFRAEVASSVAASTLKEALQEIDCPCKIDMPSLFAEAQQQLDFHVRNIEELPEDIDWTNAFGTTVLTAIETNRMLILGYLGNGAIFHIRGNFNTFPSSQLLPWTAVNYLNPHSISRGGKNVLYKILSPKPRGPQSLPSVMTLRKDLEEFGDIMLVCTDGIYSYDQTPMGRDGDEQIWISGERTLTLFFECLKSFFADRQYSEHALQASLNGYLALLRVSNLVTDDCTLGVLITEKALQYQESLWNRTAEEKSQ